MITAECGQDFVCPTALSYAIEGLSAVVILLFLFFSARKYGLTRWTRTESAQAIREAYRAVLTTSLISFRRSDPWSLHFRQEYAQVRRQYGEVSIFGVAVLHASTTMLMFLQYFADVHMFSRWAHAVWSSYGWAVVLFAMFPRLQHVKGVPVMYLFAVSLLCIYVLPVDGVSKQMVMLSNTPCMMAFIMLAPLGGLELSVLSTAVYSAVVTYSFLNASGDSVITAEAYIWWQVTTGGPIMLLGSLCNILYMSNTIRTSIERKLALQEQKAVSSLLSLVCDAVVEIDESGVIVSEARSLASLLLYTYGSKAALNGSKLQDMLYSDGDKEVFKELMNEAEAKETTTIRHVGMRDSMGSLIKTEVFHLSFSGGGSMRHLVGIKEHSDGASRSSKDLVGVFPWQSNQQEDFSCNHQQLAALVGASSDSDSDAGSSYLSRAEERFCEGTMPTSRRAVDVCLSTVMATWNMRREVRCCCSYHEAVVELRRAHGRLKSRRCNAISAPPGEQCPECGILGYTQEQGKCTICTGIEEMYPALEEPRQRRPSARSRAKAELGPPRNSLSRPPDVLFGREVGSLLTL